MEITKIAFVSDLHVNSTVALCPPVVNLDDGGTYHASRAQRWLWECWKDFWERFEKMEGRGVLFIGGDLGELDTKRRSNQLVSPNKAVILQMVTDSLVPALGRVEKQIIIRGTQAHIGKSAWLEEAVAKDLDGTVKESEYAASWYNFRGKVGGMALDVAHHVSMGGLPWTSPNAAVKLASRVLWYYRVERKEAAPRLAIRAHNHKYACSGDNYGEVMGVCLPSWSLMTEYGYRTGRELELAHVGGFFANVADGKLVRWETALYPFKEGRLWKVSI